MTIATQFFRTFNSMSDSPAIIFLGICERAAHVQDFYFNLHKWNIICLKNVMLSNLYPLPLSGLSLGIAVLGDSTDVVHKLQIVDESGDEIGTIQLTFQAASPNSEPIAPCEPPALLHMNRGCTVAFFAIDDVGMVIQKPGWCEVRLQTDQGLKTIGSLYFAVVDVEPLTPDRVAAIRSDPSASKFVRLELGCKICSSKARAYAALDRDCTSEKEGWTWYQDLPDTFVCECGKTIDLAIARRNLHAYLGQSAKSGNQLNFRPLYEKSSLEAIRAGFVHLLRTARKEEQLQKFITENPIILHQFPAYKLFAKPHILTYFVADFGIVTPQRELLLIELEKPSTRLLRKNGDAADELNHAFGQVANWLHVVDDHRLAVLDSLKIPKEQVSQVRGVVIAGRDAGNDAHALRKLKGVDRGRISFMTYDDLAFSLGALNSEDRRPLGGVGYPLGG